MMSVGTGRQPVYAVKALDVYRPEGLFDIAKVAFGATALGKLLVDQVSTLLAELPCTDKSLCTLLKSCFVFVCILLPICLLKN